MDINQQIQSIVTGLVNDVKVNLESELQARLTDEIIQRLANSQLDTIISDQVNAELKRRLETFNFVETSHTHLIKLTSEITKNLADTIGKQAQQQVSTEVETQLSQINITVIVRDVVRNAISELITLHEFPPNSIPHKSINFDTEFFITGDKVKGGIIENFGSTGIEDRATQVQMTIMDRGVAFESPLFAPGADLKGTLTVDGDLIVKGEVPTDSNLFVKLVEHSSAKVKESLNESLFEGYSEVIHKTITEKGVDLNRITMGGRDVVKDNQLGYHITDSNLQRVGVLNDLQTSGENLLSETLYVTQRRVGVNTMDPSSAFVVWDEEVELVAAKRKADTGYLGTTRHQPVVLGSNNKENIYLNTDGGVEIEKLSVGNVPMSSAAVIPNYEGITGEIVWNENPGPGGSIGWVCIGGTRWAKFGTIE